MGYKKKIQICSPVHLKFSIASSDKGCGMQSKISGVLSYMYDCSLRLQFVSARGDRWVAMYT